MVMIVNVSFIRKLQTTCFLSGFVSVDGAVVAVVDDVSVFGAGVVVEEFFGVLPPLCGGLAPPLAG